MTTRVLTGITTSGTPHLGNYVGAIRPALQASLRPGIESFYFLADLHSLIKAQDPARTLRSTLEIAASWLAAGLDPSKVWFYRQSDVPETNELTWFLTCVAGKGILNRAHAYKAAVDKNRADGEDDDAGVSAGLFMYPVLMAADILLFKAQQVPVGRDQIQHIEMARDFGQRFNHVYGRDYFTLPEALIDENVATLPGLDGRKMSKSYDNTIPLFAPREELKKRVFSIVTDSRAPGAPKDTEGSALFQLYQAFATAEETAAFAQAFAAGIGWGEAKQQLFARIDAEIAPMRERYEALMARPGDIEAILRDNAQRLRARYATPFLAELRHAVGLRDLSLREQAAPNANAATRAREEALSLVFKGPYPDKANGTWLFRVEDAHSKETLLHSIALPAREAIGGIFKRLRQGQLNHDFRLELRPRSAGNESKEIVLLDGDQIVCYGQGFHDEVEVVKAKDLLHAALLRLAE
ncbi:tryptophan--tRNA ligase [Xanthomonas translucens]|uniref:tryptophan--tRNA ligase n=1 Tax=Xanthomonas campestris pv. translucens TaxID=343 RepID=UPI0002A7AA04|nr:tryptophan--tRNA ligase [Xanthomonas translucens]AKK69320.1 tryptophan--tRNA ligase [Xanthomonas translucens pv. undulosa]AVY68286.1 tryptophan--tRNA ligase [Xanthomonas translucens pv. undulosa]ELQ07946.1 tryptophanyl-tRNA ligase [Xanthomonas translucens DAR61454]MBC3973467.1 tryptophan--tRNA ligase [Xanthomonas translucens pv. undulosa]MCT8271782.1 tryptophan--tRNA ligase [Xanthomonas translucens pv. undulosa]